MGGKGWGTCGRADEDQTERVHRDGRLAVEMLVIDPLVARLIEPREQMERRGLMRAELREGSVDRVERLAEPQVRSVVVEQLKREQKHIIFLTYGRNGVATYRKKGVLGFFTSMTTSRDSSAHLEWIKNKNKR